MELNYMGYLALGLFAFIMVVKSIRKRRNKITTINYDADFSHVNSDLHDLHRRIIPHMQKEIDGLKEEVYKLKRIVNSNYTNVKDVSSRVSDIEDIVN